MIVDLRGNCDFNIVIRTVIKKGDKAYFGVGGGDNLGFYRRG